MSASSSRARSPRAFLTFADRRSVMKLLKGSCPAAGRVQAVELGCERARLFGIGAGEQAHAEIGLANAPTGVDPRAERKAKVAAARRLYQPRGFGQGGEPDVLPCGHNP